MLDRFLALVVGHHRRPDWSLGKAREAAFAGIWDDLVTGLLSDVPVRVVTDSNVNTACVYELDRGRRALYISTVLPVLTVWDADRGGFLDSSPDWAASLVDAGFAYVGGDAARTLSPYSDEEAERRITYFEILFEWIEGSDGPDPETLTDPRDPRTAAGQPMLAASVHRVAVSPGDRSPHDEQDS